MSVIAIIADVPDKPSFSPQVDQTMTNPNQITIMFMEPDDGGSTLLGYDVQMDDGIGGGFESILPSNGLIT